MADSDDDWEFVKHVEGSSNHRTQGHGASWTGYWSHHTRRDLPTLCPGLPKLFDFGTGPEEHVAKQYHTENINSEEDQNSTAGCHVVIRSKSRGKKIYAIIPSCRSCNKAKAENENGSKEGVKLFYFCRAVTIIDTEADGSKFAGKITLPKEFSFDGKSCSDWWVLITALKVIDGDGTNRRIEIEGYSNKDNNEKGDRKRKTPCEDGNCKFWDDNNNPTNVCTKKKCMVRRAVYSNPGGYLETLAVLWREASDGEDKFRQRGVLLRYEKGFKPKILRCNVGMYPKNKKDYKEAYGLCKKDGCHQDRVDGSENCAEHPESPPLNDNDNNVNALANVLKGTHMAGSSSSAQPVHRPYGKGAAR